MQEETVPMSDEEITDEIVMVDPSQSLSEVPQHRQIEQQRRDQDMIDNQLKAVGLYEEGLSAEQKEELLAVIAASEETAQQEESMRLRAREWQQKVFPSEMDYEKLGATGGVNLSLLQPAYVNVVTQSEVEDSLQMLNIEGTAEPRGSLELLQSRKKAVVKKNQAVTHCPSSCSVRKMRQMERNLTLTERERRRLKNAEDMHKDTLCDLNESKGVQVFPLCHSPEIDEEEPIPFEDIQVDFRKQKKELDKAMPEWQPCNSPDSSPLLSKRQLQKDNKVPYKCTEEECGQHIVHTIEAYHVAVGEQQRKSLDFLQWGCPITVGRVYATRSTHSRGPDSENSDGVYSFHFPNISDQTAQTDASRSSSYLRLREFDKKYQSGLSVDRTNTMRTRGSDVAVNSLSPTSLHVINSKSAKAQACETVSKSEMQCTVVPESTKLSKQSELELAPSLMNSVNSELVCQSACGNQISLFPDSYQHICKQNKGLLETDDLTCKNGPVINFEEDMKPSEEILENCDSPLIVVDDDPFEEQENVACVSEKGARRKRVSTKLPVQVFSPSKR